MVDNKTTTTRPALRTDPYDGFLVVTHRVPATLRHAEAHCLSLPPGLGAEPDSSPARGGRSASSSRPYGIVTRPDVATETVRLDPVAVLVTVYVMAGSARPR